MIQTFLSARWENLIMANYEVNSELLKPYLPPGVELDDYDNKTLVSLVGFMFKQSRVFHIPIPFLGTFEEINLRFYVKRVENGVVKRGVVFINESVPNKWVAWLANKLYQEHYIALPTNSSVQVSGSEKQVRYEWEMAKEWNYIQVNASQNTLPMKEGSIEEYIFEHYFGYTKLHHGLSQEYRVNHPRWEVHQIHHYVIHCNFGAMYGEHFRFLNDQQPHSVMMAEGSPVTVDWKRVTF